MPAIETRAVLPPGSWRDARAYAALAATGTRGLAWELLRRDPDYPGGGDEGDGPLTAADTAFTARWGLHFRRGTRSEEHTPELQSLMRNSYSVFCLNKTKTKK